MIQNTDNTVKNINQIPYLVVIVSSERDSDVQAVTGVVVTDILHRPH